MWQSVEIVNVFNTLWLWNRFSGKRKPFLKNWSAVSYLEALWLEIHCFHTKLPYHKPMLKHTEWWVQNGPIIKSGVLPVTTLFFRKFCFSLRKSYKELTWYTNNPNAHIHTFCKRWSFIWRYLSLRVSLSRTFLPIFSKRNIFLHFKQQ